MISCRHLKYELACIGSSHAELVQLLCGGKPWKTFLDDKGGDTMGPYI